MLSMMQLKTLQLAIGLVEYINQNVKLALIQ